MTHMEDTNNIFLKQELLLARAEVDANDVSRVCFCTIQTEKAGEMLAYQMKMLQQKHLITALMDNSATVRRDHVINDTFGSFFFFFFSSLHKCKFKIEQQENIISL